MKKVLTLSSSKLLMVCGLGLILTLGGFWHHQMNQSQLGRMSILNQGLNTCYNRVQQTFTAVMIKEAKSPYLDRGFMNLSDECLNETIKGINPFKREVGKGHETLNKLIGEVHWFHEKVQKTGTAADALVAPLSERFSKIETLKVSLLDDIDAYSAHVREIQINDEVIMGLGLLCFVLGLSLLSLQEYRRIQERREIEKSALSLLKSGQASVGAMVDQLVDRALASQNMPVTNQIFKDYHGELLGQVSHHRPVATDVSPLAQIIEEQAPLITPDEMHALNIEDSGLQMSADKSSPRTSLKEVLVSLQSIHPKNALQISDLRDVQVALDTETCEQLLNAALSKLMEKRIDNRKIMVSNQIHSDRCILNLFLSGNSFSESELNFENPAVLSSDMNLMILKELVGESKSSLQLENKTDRQGNPTGMSIRLTLKRVPKERAKNLVSVMRGKKKDLAQIIN